MRRLGPSAILAAILAFPLSVHGQTGGGATGTGKILIEGEQPHAAAPNTQRYKKTLIDGRTEYNLPPKCTDSDVGKWTVTSAPRYGKTSTGIVVGNLGNGDCPGKKFHFAAIYYEWTAHNNKSNTDKFTAHWESKNFTFNGSYDITVKIVRPIGETTTFTGWAETRGLWMQTLKPPADDPNFDFTGEIVRETSVGNRDNCYDAKFPFGPATLTPHQWTVSDKVKWGPDGVGWGANTGSGGACAIEYYRCVKRTTCGFVLRQQMQISSPADKGQFVNFGPVNELSANIEGFTVPFSKSGFGFVTSKRAGGAIQKMFWPTGPLNCPKGVDLKC
jgi:hypothetical protein